ncbi:hypothetical protein [Halorussus halobius]|uniref:hypothetical protein n=1 Tax=Halorussus halobius TaxID=1710537 RepID=UPI0010925D22|nr:hypothetical protein [Halorussus halobius]
MSRLLYDHRRALFGAIALTPILLVAAFRWERGLLGLGAVLSVLLTLKAASVVLTTALRLVL